LLPNLLTPGSLTKPLWVHLYRTIRGAILAGKLPAATRLPSARTLAADLGVSRTTTEGAFSQLVAEGFVERYVGDGTYVAAVGTASGVPHPVPVGRGAASRLSSRGRAVVESGFCVDAPAPRPFSAGSPDVRVFPVDIWQRLVSRCLRRLGRALLGYGDPAGYLPLREAIAAYLGTARGVSCVADQVIVLTSSQQALDLAARLLVDPGDRVWLEEPAYPGARSALRAAGAKLVPVPVDDQGLRVQDGVAHAVGARLAYVTPSHQYPLGVTMSLERRMALLAWARRGNAWIVEDDYDSEFRYDGRPLAAMQGLDGGSRVIYVGTFTKALFPSIRLAYAVVPRELVAVFVAGRALVDGHTPTLPQAALTEFLAEGHFGAHVRRMRTLYRERRDVFVGSAEESLDGRVRLGPCDGGLHAVAYLHPGCDDVSLARRAAREGVEVPPLSRYFCGGAKQRGFFLGYGGLTPEVIREGMERLSRIFRSRP
jgi:GntR family transcriptional regulator/MocR family aminotransferase